MLLGLRWVVLTPFTHVLYLYMLLQSLRGLRSQQMAPLYSLLTIWTVLTAFEGVLLLLEMFSITYYLVPFLPEARFGFVALCVLRPTVPQHMMAYTMMPVWEKYLGPSSDIEHWKRGFVRAAVQGSWRLHKACLGIALQRGYIIAEEVPNMLQ